MNPRSLLATTPNLQNRRFKAVRLKKPVCNDLLIIPLELFWIFRHLKDQVLCVWAVGCWLAGKSLVSLWVLLFSGIWMLRQFSSAMTFFDYGPKLRNTQPADIQGSSCVFLRRSWNLFLFFHSSHSRPEYNMCERGSADQEQCKYLQLTPVIPCPDISTSCIVMTHTAACLGDFTNSLIFFIIIVY